MLAKPQSELFGNNTIIIDNTVMLYIMHISTAAAGATKTLHTFSLSLIYNNHIQLGTTGLMVHAHYK